MPPVLRPAAARPGTDRTWLVALAAALWGTDAIFRLPLTQQIPAATIVTGEHLVLVLLTLPWLPRAIRAARRTCSPTDWLALLLIGAGASAVATVMFTSAFAHSGPVTPVVLQKVQPLVAVLGARLLLGERLRPRYGAFLVAALVGGWFLSFPDPGNVTVSGITGAALATGAAALWAAGTVVGRLLSPRLSYTDLTALRFAIGLPAAYAATVVTGQPALPPLSTAPTVIGLALVPGLLALLLYYYALAATPAARATLAELAFPGTAAVVGVLVLHAHLTAGQWVGLVLLVATVVLLARSEHRSTRPAVVPALEPV